MKPHYTLSTIIVDYRLTEKTVQYVKEELLCKCSVSNIVVIVNNGATVSSSQALSDALKAVIIKDITLPLDYSADIYVIHNPDNSGFAKGNNLGVDFVVKHFEVDYLLFSNNDIKFIDNNVVEKLIEKLSMNDRIGAIGPKVIGLDGKCQSPYVYVPYWAEILWMSWGRFLPFFKFKDIDRDMAKEGFYYRLIGAFFMVPLGSYLECDKMDSHTFLYMEEAILAERMLKTGKLNFYYPQVSVLHEHGLTTSKYSRVVNNALLDSALYYFRTYRNIHLFNIVLGRIIVVLYIVFRRMKNLFRKIYNATFLSLC